MRHAPLIFIMLQVPALAGKELDDWALEQGEPFAGNSALSATPPSRATEVDWEFAEVRTLAEKRNFALVVALAALNGGFPESVPRCGQTGPNCLLESL